MSPLYGRHTGEQSRKTVTRRGFESVESRLEDWENSVRTVMYRDGSFEVYIGSRHDPRNLVLCGSVDVGRLAFTPEDHAFEGTPA